MRKALLSLLILLSPGLAFAHTGVSAAHDVLHGFLHPLTGLDHVLAMVSVGLFAAQRGGRALWALPLVFVSMMAVGGVLGMSGVALPGVEAVISASVIVLGACVMSGLRIPTAFAAALVGVFAVFHGHAHGAEMPATASGLTYGLSFMAATALLHGLGIGLYLTVIRFSEAFRVPITRALGGLITLAGIALLFGA